MKVKTKTVQAHIKTYPLIRAFILKKNLFHAHSTQNKVEAYCMS